MNYLPCVFEKQDPGWKIPEFPFLHTQKQSFANTAKEGTMLKNTFKPQPTK